MKVTIHPGVARGTITAPPSKSMAHRLLICAGLSQGVSRISGIEYSEDILATLDCLRTLGAVCTPEGDTVTVVGTDPRNTEPDGSFCCRESGSTLRFFIPLALLGENTVSFTGTKKLLSRPLELYRPLCREFTLTEDSLQVQGTLTGGRYQLPGDVSSQFLSGLLFSLPLAREDSYLTITTPLESKSYLAMTLQALSAFGVEARWQDSRTLYIPGNQRYVARDMAVEGDYSAAAVFQGMNALGAEITVLGLKPDTLQGDKVYSQHLQSLCCGTPQIDLSNCPDLAPVLFAVAAARQGAVFTGTRRLKFKESDRAAAMARELAAFGAKVLVEENTVTVTAAPLHAPERALQSHNDHRIVMALTVLLLLTGGAMEGAEAVEKSFPAFFRKLEQLGIRIDYHKTSR